VSARALGSIATSPQIQNSRSAIFVSPLPPPTTSPPTLPPSCPHLPPATYAVDVRAVTMPSTRGDIVFNVWDISGKEAVRVHSLAFSFLSDAEPSAPPHLSLTVSWSQAMLLVHPPAFTHSLPRFTPVITSPPPSQHRCQRCHHHVRRDQQRLVSALVRLVLFL
jgi:hypothetical protein